MTLTVIIPAHDEEAVIARTLTALLDGPAPGFAVIVAANGCRDRTAGAARQSATRFPAAAVTVLEIAQPGKTNAVNAALELAAPGPVILLDADITLPRPALMAMGEALLRDGIGAATGTMDVDLDGASLPVRAFYAVWRHQPYFDQGKFGGVIGLSATGRARVTPLPAVTGDDEYLRRSFTPAEVAHVPAARFTVRAPRTLAALIKVRTRSRRGAAQVAGREGGQPVHVQGQAGGLMARIARRPWLWPAALVYLGVQVAAIRGARATAGQTALWERDETTRQPAAPHGPVQ